MKRAGPFHPPLFATFPILAVFSANQVLLPIQELWLPLFCAIAAAITFWAILALATQHMERGAIGGSVLCVALLLYGRTFGTMKYTFGETMALSLWGIVTVGLAVGLMWKLYSAKIWNVVGLMLLCASAGQIVLFKFQSLTFPGTMKHAAADVEANDLYNPPAFPVVKRPGSVQRDIFYIILDGHGRQDRLKQYLGYDNSWFIRGLRARGFFVADAARANYSQTEQSLGSSLNEDFLQNLVTESDDMNREHLDQIITNNRFSKEMESIGYTTTAVTTGFPAVRFDYADLWIQSPTKTSFFADLVLEQTPFSAYGNVAASMFDQRRNQIDSALKSLARFGPRGPRPRFIFAHIVAPHPPFVFGANGEKVPHKGQFGFYDGSDYVGVFGTPTDYRNGYVGQVTYIEKRILDVIDDLQDNRDKPIIILQGDHGSKLHLDQGSLEHTELNEVFPNLVAVAGPPEVQKRLYPSISPVNLLRIVRGAVSGQNVQLLPDRCYFSVFGRAYRFTDVTDRVR